jgi:hypothetical protein
VLFPGLYLTMGILAWLFFLAPLGAAIGWLAAIIVERQYREPIAFPVVRFMDLLCGTLGMGCGFLIAVAVGRSYVALNMALTIGMTLSFVSATVWQVCYRIAAPLVERPGTGGRRSSWRERFDTCLGATPLRRWDRLHTTIRILLIGHVAVIISLWKANRAWLAFVFGEIGWLVLSTTVLSLAIGVAWWWSQESAARSEERRSAIDCLFLIVWIVSLVTAVWHFA